jgi:hypothetical protein
MTIYTINAIPGCENAGRQSYDRAVRKTCAYVAALASEQREGGLVAPPGWAEEEAKNLNLNLKRVGLWLDAMNGRRMSAMPRAEYCGLALSEYQIADIKTLSCAGGGLGYDPGLGKTVTATGAAETLVRGGDASSSRCWIVCPLNAIPTWEQKSCMDELRRIFDEVRVLSMDSMHKYVGASDVGGVLIFDESHGGGNWSARRTQAMHKIRPRFDACLSLSGTFMQGGVEKTLSFLDMMIPGLAGFSSEWKAGECFKCLVRKKIPGRNQPVTEIVEPPAAEHANFFKWWSRQVVMRTYDDELVRKAFYIPPHEIVEVELCKPWPLLREKAVQLAWSEYEKTKEFPVAAKIAAILAAADKEAKWKWVEENILPCGEQVVVFAYYTDTLDFVESRLVADGISYVRVDGEVVGRKRKGCEQGFQRGDARVFLGQLHAAALSMNLQNCCISVTLDRAHSAAAVDYAQSIKRTHRRGQLRDCIHFDLVSNQLQQAIVRTIKKGQDFAADAAEYCEIKQAIPKG